MTAVFLNLRQPSPWSARAACRDFPDVFYPADTDADAIAAAKEVCSWCPVRAECLNDAITRGETHGIWGGTTPEERKTQTTHAQCGTSAGRNAHHRRGEAVCAPCKAAANEYTRELKLRHKAEDAA